MRPTVKTKAWPVEQTGTNTFPNRVGGRYFFAGGSYWDETFKIEQIYSVEQLREAAGNSEAYRQLYPVTNVDVGQ